MTAGRVLAGTSDAPAEAGHAEPVIELRNVSFAYDGPRVLEDVSLTVRRGEFACIVGPNGGGKSTLLKLMLGLLEPQSGEVRLLGQPPRVARRRIGYLPQHVQFDPQFPITVMDVVLMGRLGESRRFGPFRRADRAIAEQALEEVRMRALARRPFSALSGGQRRRVLIARALACQPEILMLDEPTANLDIQVEEQLYELLRELNRRLTIVLVSHDVAYVSKYVRSAICVNRTVHTHSGAQITHEVIRNLFGREIRLLLHEPEPVGARPHGSGADACCGEAPPGASLPKG